jgi:Zn ribbon nucleic-acid-binding protein
MCDKVECPYCEYDNNITYDDHEGNVEFEIECGECGEEFSVTAEYEPTYYANKIEYKKCIDCGKKYRFKGRYYPKPNKYEHLKDEEYNVCNDCFCRAYLEGTV